MLISHLCFFFNEDSAHIVCQFIKTKIYMIQMQVLSGTYGLRIFHQFVSCLFLLLTVSSKEQKFFILINPHLSICYFMVHAFGVIYFKRILPNLVLKDFYPHILCSIILGSTFRYVYIYILKNVVCFPNFVLLFQICLAFLCAWYFR